MKKILSVMFVLILAAVWLGGCRTLPGSSDVTTNVSSGGGTTTTNIPNLSSISTSANGEFGVAVGLNGTSYQATVSTSGTGEFFPTWTPIATGTSSNLLGVAFDLNSGTLAPANVIAVGQAGTILENTSSGASGWVIGNAANGLTLSDAACPATTISTLSAVALNGVTVFSNTNEASVIVGTPLTDTCGHAKGVIAVSTSAIGTLPYNGFVLVDGYGASDTAIPDVPLQGVSFSQGSDASPFVVVVGQGGTILVGNTSEDLTQPASWTLNTPSNLLDDDLTSVAIGPDNQDAITVGGHGGMYLNDNLGVNTSWTQFTLPNSIPARAFYSVHFIPTTSGTLTAVAVGQTTSTPIEPIAVLISNCCNPANASVSEITLPTLSGLPTGSEATLNGVWSSVGPAEGLVVAVGGVSTGVTGGFILESDTGGASPYNRDTDGKLVRVK